MKFQLEKLIDVIEEVSPLIHKHYKEIAHYQDIPLNPDFDKYAFLDEKGVLRFYTARSYNGELVGYAVFFVQKNMHYRDSIQALQDILFVKKENRGMGGRLIKWCDAQLQSEGVQVIYHHVKKAHNFGPLLERMGYECVDLIYGKRLDQAADHGDQMGEV